jgi:5-methylcytosine-specific restriction endonuclease McrA
VERDTYRIQNESAVVLCGNQPAPFVTEAGEPYLESHHIRRLSDSGPDDPLWVAALCANCHRRAHYAVDANAYNLALQASTHKEELALRGDANAPPERRTSYL